MQTIKDQFKKRVEDLREQYEWGDITPAAYRKEAEKIIREYKTHQRRSTAHFQLAMYHLRTRRVK